MTVRHRAPSWIALSVVAACATSAGAARAQERTDYRDVYGNVLGMIGLGKDRDPIDYSPRPPIVVPPSNDLPPPVEPGSLRGAGFPNDPDVAARRKALVDPRQPAPVTATGGARNYLIDPPAAYFDGAAVAATGNEHDKGGGQEPAKHVRHRRNQASAQ